MSETEGRLYVVSLPIGNLGDISLRALRTLRSVDVVLAEDTRTTSRVFARYGIRTKFGQSVYQGVESERVDAAIALLQEGKKIALVSDAGTPLVSDPGFPLVRAAVEHGIPVEPVPGASAVLAALVASGAPAQRFVFDGMLPRKASARQQYFQRIAREEPRTVVVYESPHRLLDTLADLAATLPERPVVLAKELTKRHEEFLRGDPPTLLGQLQCRERIQGEWVIILEQPDLDPDREACGSSGGKDADIAETIALLRESGLPTKISCRILKAAFGISRNDAYRMLSGPGATG